jgi:hypothetical protein
LRHSDRKDRAFDTATKRVSVAKLVTAVPQVIDAIVLVAIKGPAFVRSESPYVSASAQTKKFDCRKVAGECPVASWFS